MNNLIDIILIHITNEEVQSITSSRQDIQLNHNQNASLNNEVCFCFSHSHNSN